MKTILLSVNSIFLIAATIICSFLFMKHINFNKLISSGISRLNDEYRERRLLREVKKYSTAISIKMSLVERVEFYFIDKSNIRHYIPFMNFYVLLFMSLIIFVISFEPVFRILYFIPSTAIICILLSVIPLFLLDLMSRFNSEKIRRQLAEFISVLNRWCAVKEDIFYAFEKSVNSCLGEPLRTFISDMVIQVQCGIEPIDALNILQLKVDNEQFRDFIINVKQNIRSRGDIGKLLTNLEYQYYEIEKEYNRRRISTYRDRLTIYVIMACVLLIGYFFLSSSEKIREFYLGTTSGKLLLTLFCILYTSGIYLTTKITKFKY